MIMRFRPANIRLINRHSKLLRLLLALSSGKESNDNDKTTPLLSRVDTVTPYQAESLNECLGDFALPNQSRLKTGCRKEDRFSFSNT